MAPKPSASLLAQARNGVSALELTRHLGVSYQAAWRIKHKLMTAMAERESPRQLSGRVEIDDLYLGGERPDTPARGSPNKVPFVIAVGTRGGGFGLTSLRAEGTSKVCWATQYRLASGLPAMLDTHARRWIQPGIDALARRLVHLGLSANGATLGAMLLGVAAAVSVASVWPWLGIALLWLSGLLDAIDGTIARMTHPSPLGAILDITFDRVVELSMVIALGWLYPRAMFLLLILAATIAVAMSLFLSIAAALRNTSAKAFHYAPGLGERSEAFICLSLMALDARHLRFWTAVFIAIIVYTMFQRLRHAARALADES